MARPCSEPKVLSALRAPFLSQTQRLGAVYVEGDGVVGSMRALQLVAKVGALRHPLWPTTSICLLTVPLGFGSL